VEVDENFSGPETEIIDGKRLRWWINNNDEGEEGPKKGKAKT
jgi:hypothetical protein